MEFAPSVLINWIASGLVGLAFGSIAAWVTYSFRRKSDIEKWQRERQARSDEVAALQARRNQEQLRDELLRGVDDFERTVKRLRQLEDIGRPTAGVEEQLDASLDPDMSESEPDSVESFSPEVRFGRELSHFVELFDRMSRSNRIAALIRLLYTRLDGFTYDRICSALTGMCEDRTALAIRTIQVRDGYADCDMFRYDAELSRWPVEKDDLASSLSILARESMLSRNRLQAARMLIRLGEKVTGCGALVDLARTADYDVDRLAAAQELLDAGELEMGQNALRDIMTADVPDHIMATAARSLAYSGDFRTALGALTGVARGESEDTPRRIAAACAIGEIGETATATRILSAFVEDPCEETSSRIRAARALHAFGTTDVSVKIVTMIAADRGETEACRLDAARALDKMGHPTAAARALETIITQNGGDLNRLHLTGALAELGEGAIPNLTRLAQSASDAHVRWRATRLLGQLGEGAVSSLETLASNSPEEQVRYRAASALYLLGHTSEASPHLEILASTASNDLVRSSCAAILKSDTSL